MRTSRRRRLLRAGKALRTLRRHYLSLSSFADLGVVLTLSSRRHDGQLIEARGAASGPQLPHAGVRDAAARLEDVASFYFLEADEVGEAALTVLLDDLVPLAPARGFDIVVVDLRKQ